MHVAVVCACLPAGKPFLRKHLPNIIGSSYGASVGTKRRTIRSTHTQQLPSRDAGEDSQDIILEGNINSKLRRHTGTAYSLANNCDIGRSPTNVSTTTVELATEQAFRTEYGSDKGLFITGSQEAGIDDS